MNVQVVNNARKAAVTVYRLVSFCILYGILFSIFAYAGAFLFYASSTSWIVPFSVANSDSNVLTIMSQLTTSSQAVNALQLDCDKTVKTLDESLTQKRNLVILDNHIDQTIKDQKKVWAKSATQLLSFGEQKTAANAVLTADTEKDKDLRRIIEKDLAAGVITKADAET